MGRGQTIGMAVDDNVGSGVIEREGLAWLRLCRQQGLPVTTPELTRGNRESQFHEFLGGSTSKVNSNYRSRSQWLQLPNQVVGLCYRLGGDSMSELSVFYRLEVDRTESD